VLGFKPRNSAADINKAREDRSDLPDAIGDWGRPSRADETSTTLPENWHSPTLPEADAAALAAIAPVASKTQHSATKNKIARPNAGRINGCVGAQPSPGAIPNRQGNKELELAEDMPVKYFEIRTKCNRFPSTPLPPAKAYSTSLRQKRFQMGSSHSSFLWIAQSAWYSPISGRPVDMPASIAFRGSPSATLAPRHDAPYRHPDEDKSEAEEQKRTEYFERYAV
jgi:hypothetical protein